MAAANQMSYSISKYLILFAICIVYLGIGANSNAQMQFDWGPPVFDDGKTGHARRLIQQGKNEEAIEFLLPLYETRKYGNHSRVVDLLIEAMENLKEYDSLLTFSKSYINDFPDSTRGYLIQAKALFLKEEDQKASEILNAALETLPDSEEKYRDVAGEYLRNGIMQEAIDVYLSGREFSDQEDRFAMELANIYEILGRYDQAASEHLLMAIKQPTRVSMANNRIKSIFESAEDRKDILTALEKTAERYPENEVKFVILANAYRLADENDKALESYIEYDRITEHRGRQLISFLSDCIEDQQYALAIRGADYIIGTYEDNSPYYWRCRQIIAEAYEGKGDIDEAKAVHRAIIDESDERHIKVQSHIRLGEYAFDENHFDNAESHFGEVRQLAPGSKHEVYARIRLGDIQFFTENIDSALQIYSTIDAANFDEAEEELMFKITQMEFYLGNFDRASLIGMRYIFDYPSGKFANDCLLLLDLIEQVSFDSLGLLNFAKADFKRNIEHFDEAESLFSEISMETSNNIIKEASYLKTIDLNVERKDYDQAVRLMESFEEKHPNSYYVPQVLFELADLYKNQLNKEEKAAAIYQRIINKFPESLIIDDVRRNLRSIS
ncbi:MAG: tetratricopeptide repeat protein [candidate division Zixibacteria bacterium]|nr:tetratricopeptide repeat protein [candidate division Zixibacteria bacterium]